MNMVTELGLKQVVVSKFNPRKHFDDKAMADLVASVKEKGIINPVIVRKVNGGYELVCGERRYRASQKAGKTTIRAIVHTLTDHQALELQITENLQRSDVHPLEEAEGYEVLMKKSGYKTIADLAVKVGKSKVYIYGRLKLCELIPENRKLFYEGKFTPSIALLVARVPKDRQKEVGKDIGKGMYGDEPMSYKRAHEHIMNNFMLRLKEAPFDTKDKTLAGKQACAVCSKKTGNEKELFADIKSADTCTDPTCYKEKKNAHMQRTLDQVKKSGKKILSLDEAKKLFRYERSNDPEHKYINLAQTCYDIPKTQKYRELVKRVKDIEIIYVIHPYSGQLIEMIAKEDLPKIFKKLGLKTTAETSSAAVTPGMKAKVRAGNRIRENKRSFWIDKVSTAKDRRCMNVVTLDIILDSIGGSTAEKLLPFKPGRGYGRAWSITKLYEIGDAEVQKIIVKAISKKSDYLMDEDLKFLSTKLGHNVAKEYVITETYLQAYTKDGLVKLAKEIGLTEYLKKQEKNTKKTWGPLDLLKKTTLIDLFLKKGFILKNKVPKEMSK